MSAIPPSKANPSQYPKPPALPQLYRVRQRRNRNGHPYLMNPRPTCPYCGKSFVTAKSCSQHMAMKAECREKEGRAIEDYVRRQSNARRESSTGRPEPLRSPSPTQWGPWIYPTDMPPAQPVTTPSDAQQAEAQSQAGNSNVGSTDSDVHGPSSDTSARVCREFVEYYPSESAGAPISSVIEADFDLGAYIGSCGPFAEPKTFRAAELLMSANLTNAERTEFLESEVYQGQVPWHNCRSMMLDIDVLPSGPTWSSRTIIVEGDVHTYVLYVFKRNIIQVVRELIGNTKLKWEIHYAPQRHWTTIECLLRIYNEMWTSDWWWEMQELLDEFDKSGTIAALIISSDKSCVSAVLNGKHVYPVYVTLGNISKSTRRKSSNRACVLLGYLPVEAFKDEPKAVKSRLRQEVLHAAMEELLAPLKEAWREGVEMLCADGCVRRVHPTLAAFEGDWPEQCDMACTLASGCPMCAARRQNRGNINRPAPMRDPLETITSLFYYKITQNPNELKAHQLRPSWPFWAYLWPINLHEAIAPDLLHQIYIGMFKDHLLVWGRRLLGDERIDKRFSAMPKAKGIRHFPYGICKVQRWTGRESKEMAKVLLPMLVDKANPQVLEAMRSLVDFCFLAHSTSMTDEDLTELDHCLRNFHRHKSAIANAALVGKRGFNGIPKLHMLSHYTWSIRRLGVPDGYSTETPEHLHIEYAKIPWRKSNRRHDALPQMIRMLRRREAIRIHRTHMDDYFGPRKSVRRTRDALEETVEEDGGEEWYDCEDESAGGGVSGVTYPTDGWLYMANKPARRRTIDHVVVDDYVANGFTPALQRHLSPNAKTESDRLLVNSLSTHHYFFDIWHRIYLYHRRLPFARHEPRKCDVLRARPVKRDPSGKRIVHPGEFDTALIMDSPDRFGIYRFRVVRIRVIFRLPSELRHLCPHHLAFVELFTPFNPQVTQSHRLYSLSHAMNDGRRRTAVIPVSRIVMACHLVPRFNTLSASISLNHRADLLARCSRFFFNHYHNFFVFLLIRHWRRVARQQKLDYM